MTKEKLLLPLVLLSAIGCSGPSSNSSGGSVLSSCTRVSALAAGNAEKTYCSVQTISGSSVTITGTGQYQARTINPADPSGTGLDQVTSLMPIRYAEVEVLDSNGNLVQCGETDSSGNFSLTVPQGSNALTIQVNSRANNSNVKASVLGCPETNQYYSVSATFTPSASQSVTIPTAGYTGEILGGAFNILDQIVKANDYLRSKVSNCSGTYSGCSNFTVAEKVNVYWEKGYNPNSYFGAGSSGLSFYAKGYKRLFILGGINGDVDSSDTDHFDNSVILHEYAHFLEDVFTTSDSPGGSHSADAVIDPRLAWSEGFANFFQAAVTGYSLYVDTAGNPSGSTSDFRINLENQSGNYVDKPRNSNEGNFREFSVTRVLVDAIDSNNDLTDTISDGFADIWASITKTTGLNNTSAAFRSVGLVHLAQAGLGGQNWTNIQSMGKHIANRSEYGQYVTTTAGGCDLSTSPFTITPTSASRYDDDQDGGTLNDGSFDKSHLLLNNQFYHYAHSGGAFNLTLNYRAQDTSSGTVANLDLIVFKDGYTYTDSSNWVNDPSTEGISTPSSTNPATTYSETVSESSLAEGHYLIAVKAYAVGTIGTAQNFELVLNGTNLCADTLLP